MPGIFLCTAATNPVFATGGPAAGRCYAAPLPAAQAPGHNLPLAWEAGPAASRGNLRKSGGCSHDDYHYGTSDYPGEYRGHTPGRWEPCGQHQVLLPGPGPELHLGLLYAGLVVAQRPGRRSSISTLARPINRRLSPGMPWPGRPDTSSFCQRCRGIIPGQRGSEPVNTQVTTTTNSYTVTAGTHSKRIHLADALPRQFPHAWRDCPGGEPYQRVF